MQRLILHYEIMELCIVALFEFYRRKYKESQNSKLIEINSADILRNCLTTFVHNMGKVNKSEEEIEGWYSVSYVKNVVPFRPKKLINA